MNVGSVVVHRSVSLDGFVAGPKHEMDWIFEHPAPGLAQAVMRDTGAMLSGRHTYDVGRQATRPETSAAYGGAWTGPQFVLTHRPRNSEDDPDVMFLSGDVRRAVATALAAAGGKNLEVLGTDVTAQCLSAGLIDEIVVHLLPVLLGAGVPLHRSPALDPIALSLTESAREGSVTALRYRVVR